ncbi:MAG TPA: hypothetical protein VHE36_09695 [Sphingomicrobium sp.]|jgi:hypothetical protein|nr:hypothetical protein [Sphingomicrobium sp.]
MRIGNSKAFLGAIAAGSFLLSSTAAVAAQPAPAQVDPLVVLSVMSGAAPATALCGTSTSTESQGSADCVQQASAAPASAQAGQARTIPVPPVEPYSAGLGISPLILGLVAVAAAVGLYAVLHHNGGGNHPVSPA